MGRFNNHREKVRNEEQSAPTIFILAKPPRSLGRKLLMPSPNNFSSVLVDVYEWLVTEEDGGKRILSCSLGKVVHDSEHDVYGRGVH